MGYNEEEDTSRQLYESFIEALNSGGDISSFDEDELISVFDFAYGESNEYVKYEVLNTALLHFPDNRELNERRVMFLNEFMPSELILPLSRKLSRNSFVRRALAVYEYDTAEKQVKYLISLIDEVKDGALEDMHVFFLCHLFEKIDMFDRLEGLAEKISSVSESPVAVYAFLYQHFADVLDNEKVIEYGEKITDVDSFMDNVWGMMALSHAYNGDSSESIKETADFALAINPRNSEALIAKAYQNIFDNPAESRRLFDEIIAEKPDVLVAYYYRALASISETDSVSKYLKDYCDKGGEFNMELYEVFYSFVDSDTRLYLDKRLGDLLNKQEFDVNYKWCETLIEMDKFSLAERVCRIYKSKLEEFDKFGCRNEESLIKMRYLWYVSLYLQGNYYDIINDYSLVKSTDNLYVGEAPAILIVLLCWHNTGVPVERLKDFTNTYIKLLSNYMTDPICYLSDYDIAKTLFYLKNFQRFLSGDAVSQWEYNPFYIHEDRSMDVY
ncbi:MAG: hypothetical protein K2M94_04715 [Paramuribaculum sp.]|nr:hypothetical protein [Paramuribaculum sp.]